MLNSERNLRFIALNTQACDAMNFNLIGNPTDPMNMLEWLHNVLLSAEKKSESVILFGHIPTGDDFCVSNYGKRYTVLMERFAHIIRGQFFGHTHNDHIQLVKSWGKNNVAKGTTVGTVLVAPSFTTYRLHNPSFRVYELDQETNVLINYHQYRLDLQKYSKTDKKLIWDLAYDFLTEYNVTNMKPSTLATHIEQLDSDNEKVRKYNHHYRAGTDSTAKISPSKRKYYKCLGNAVSSDFYKCAGLSLLMNDPKAIAFVVLEHLSGDWYEKIE